MRFGLVFLCCLLPTFSAAKIHEPSCSQFDYDKKILENLVRVEHRMELLEKKFAHLETAITAKLTSYDVIEAERKKTAGEYIVAMETIMSVEKEVSDIKSDIEQKLNDIKVSMKKGVISFMAQLSQSIDTPSKGHVVIFDDVITNEGSGYDRLQGIFTAPVNGIYNFNLVASSPSKLNTNALHLYIMKNRKQVGYIFLDCNVSYWIHRSTDITIQAGTGDQVWVEIGLIQGSAVLAGCCFHTHLSGFLIGVL